jgi:hypothetical protein
MRSCIAIVAVGIVGWPGVALADGVGNEVTAGSSEAAADGASTTFISNRLWGTADIHDAVTVRAEGSFTRDASSSRGFDDRGGNIYRLVTSVDFYPSDHVAIGVEGSYSPPTSTTSLSTVPLARPGGDVAAEGRAEVLSRSSTWSAGADIEYDSAGDSSFEWVVGTGVGVHTYSSFQQLGDVFNAVGGMVEPGLVIAQCGDMVECSDEVAAAMAGMAETVHQVKMSATGMATIATDTDAGVTGSYSLYTADPTELGFFRLAALGRDQVLGEGTPHAPVRFTARPNVAHRIGRVQLGSWFEYARYVADEGDALALGLRVQVRVGGFRIWCAGVGQHDRGGGPDGAPLRGGSLSLGARVRF